MTNSKTIEKNSLPTGDETTKQIEEAAYYSWLNRGRYAQAGNELHDWIEGEKEVRNGSPATRTANNQNLLPLETTFEKEK